MSLYALQELIASLPTISETHTIILTGNPGVASLSNDDIAVATEKEWTVTK